VRLGAKCVGCQSVISVRRRAPERIRSTLCRLYGRVTAGLRTNAQNLACSHGELSEALKSEFNAIQPLAKQRAPNGLPHCGTPPGRSRSHQVGQRLGRRRTIAGDNDAAGRGKSLRLARDRIERIFVHRCAWGGVPATIRCSVEVSEIDDIDKKSALVRFSSAKLVGAQPSVLPQQGQNSYDADPPVGAL
jgi:hypothetical protein